MGVVAAERWQVLLKQDWTFAAAVVSSTQDCYGHSLLQSLSVRLGLSAKRHQSLIQHSSTSSQVCIEH